MEGHKRNKRTWDSGQEGKHEKQISVGVNKCSQSMKRKSNCTKHS